jgi:thiamine pyrophosphate-dependent acetolactate synthase large subunit-like protein
VDFGPVCQGFGVPYAQVSSTQELEEAMAGAIGVPGISFVSARLPLRGVRERYGKYW